MVVTGARVAGRIRITVARLGGPGRRRQSPAAPRGVGRSATRARHRSDHRGGERASWSLRPLPCGWRLRRSPRAASRRARLRARRVSRRSRASPFLLAAALICAMLAATVAGRYRPVSRPATGPLRAVVVSTAELAAGAAIGGGAGGRGAVGPPGTGAIHSARGHQPPRRCGRTGSRGADPPGSYVLGAQLVVPGRSQHAGHGGRRRPAPTGLGRLARRLLDRRWLARGKQGGRRRLPAGGPRFIGRARIAASSVEASRSPEPAGPGGGLVGDARAHRRAGAVADRGAGRREGDPAASREEPEALRSNA